MQCQAYNQKRCASCEYINHSYDESVALKLDSFRKLFPEIDSSVWQEPFLLQNPFASRYKLKLSAKQFGESIVFGVYDKDQNFSPLEDCPLHVQTLNDLLAPLKRFFHQAKLTAYDLPTRTGELKGVVISQAFQQKDMAIRLILRSKESVDRIKKLLPDFLAREPQVKVFSCSIQPKHIAVLDGDEELCFTEKNAIMHNFSHARLLQGSNSFFQVSPTVADALYSDIRIYLQQNSYRKMLDLYCGVGAFSFYSAKMVKNVIGVEVNPQAINYANAAKSLNNGNNIEFYSMDVKNIWDDIDDDFDVVLVNPPRRGVGTDNMNKILKLNPDLFIYSSCNAKTLREDFQVIKDHYQVKYIRVFDMFPFTKHFETLMIFHR